MHLNINGIVETESALVSNLLPKLPKYSTWVNLVLMWERPYVFFYSWLHILEDKNLDNTLTDCKRTGSSLSTSHYVIDALNNIKVFRKIFMYKLDKPLHIIVSTCRLRKQERVGSGGKTFQCLRIWML